VGWDFPKFGGSPSKKIGQKSLLHLVESEEN
jgi:hypothetical protein